MAEPNIIELVDFGKRAVDFAVGRGAEEAEAFLSMVSGTSIDIERGQIVRSIKRMGQGLGVRAVYRKAVGFSYVNTLTDKNVQEAAARAFRAARASRSDKNWLNLPSPRRFGEIRGTYDKKVVAISSDELVETAAVMLGAVEAYDKRVLSVAGRVGASVFHTVVVNSHGVEAFDRGTAVGCSMETIARDGADVTPACFELNAERVYDIDPEGVGREAARQAVSSLKARKIDSGAFPVIFTQAAFRSLIYYTLINAVKADYVQRERSALKDKIGEKVASDLVTVYDDGLLDGGLLTRKFDGEGVPCQKTLVIDKGVLKHFLYDNYTANKAGAESTGNASRTGLAPYASTPVLEASNFTFTGGNKTPEELVGEVEEGLIVYGVQGAHSSNPESGEFSVVATPVWKIEDGNVAYAVREVMLTGVIFDVLRNVSALGNNVRKMGQLVAPWIRVENVRAVGRK
ncbi:MAG: TldD/PmbA family protein [Candidatus Bathyarchaeota archaeon]|nr:TldD/PmbA family protein [Candidatus Bathyarchaeota archaeon]